MSERWPSPGSQWASLCGNSPTRRRAIAGGTMLSAIPCQTRTGNSTSCNLKSHGRASNVSSHATPRPPWRSASAVLREVALLSELGA